MKKQTSCMEVCFFVERFALFMIRFIVFYYFALSLKKAFFTYNSISVFCLDVFLKFFLLLI